MKNKSYLWAGLALMVIGVAGAAFSQLLVEDILGIERPFGEEPLSIQITRFGLVAATLGLGLLLYGAWRNRRK